MTLKATLWNVKDCLSSMVQRKTTSEPASTMGLYLYEKGTTLANSHPTPVQGLWKTKSALRLPLPIWTHLPVGLPGTELEDTVAEGEGKEEEEEGPRACHQLGSHVVWAEFGLSHTLTCTSISLPVISESAPPLPGLLLRHLSWIAMCHLARDMSLKRAPQMDVYLHHLIEQV